MLRNADLSVEIGAFDEVPYGNTGSRFEEIENKASQFLDHVIRHPSLVRCEAQIRTLHRSAIQRAKQLDRQRLDPCSVPVLGPSRGMLITGLTGTGKSTISKQYEAQFPREYLADRTIIPVLRVELPSQPRAKVIAEQVLIAMGDPFSNVGTAENRFARAKKLVRECQTTLIIFDEIQHVTDNLDARSADVAADALKNFMSLGVPVVFIGLPSARAYFVRNQQLGRRCTPKVKLVPFGAATPQQRKEFQALLNSLHRLLPTVGPSALIDPNCAGALHAASFGLLGQLTQLVEAALRVALTLGDQSLTREHLKQAFEETIFPDCGHTRNPFDAKFNGKPLVDPDEPYNCLKA